MLAEHLLMRPAEFLPSFDVGNKHPGAHHMAEFSSLLSQGLPDDIEATHGLSVTVPHGMYTSILRNRRRAGNPHAITGTQRPAVPYT